MLGTPPSAITILLLGTVEQRRNVVGKQLEALGYNVITVPDYRSFNDILKLSRYDLLIVDLSSGDSGQVSALAERAAELLGQGVPVLMLTADQHANPEAWTQETLSYRVAAVLRNRNVSDVLSARTAHWEGLNVLDPETTLFNRRYFEALFPIEIERSRRTHQPLTILLLDLVAAPPNDAMRWHAFSSRLLTSLRQTDIVVRYEAMRVLVVLPATESAVARAVAARLMKTLIVSTAVGDQPLQINIGIAAYPQHGTTAAALLAAVHHALNHILKPGTILSFDQL